MKPILAFDVESNGLYGDAFMVAATVLAPDGSEPTHFIARCPITDEGVDPWVAENVIPACWQIPENCESLAWMCRDFSDWYAKTVSLFPDALIIADCAWPVDAGFLLTCMNTRASPEGIGTGIIAPKPLHDLATLFLALGLDPWNTSRKEYARPLFAGHGAAHDPRYDALLVAHCTRRALKELEDRATLAGKT